MVFRKDVLVCPFMYLLVLGLFAHLGEGQHSYLEKLVVIFRHGFRYPVSLAFTEGDKCASGYTDDQIGQLTPKGIQQMTLFGQVMRRRYNTFLGNCAQVQVQYGNEKRTKDSGALAFNEICPKSPNPGPNIFPISDKLIGTLFSDPSHALQFLQDVPIKESYYKLLPTYHNITLNQCASYPTVSRFVDQVNSEIEDGCCPGDWVTPDVKENVKDYIDDFFATLQCGTKYKYINQTSGGMYQWIDQVFQGSSSDSSTKGFFLALHDYNVGMDAARIGIFNGLSVPFGAALVFELWRLREQKVVRTFYMNVTDYSHMYQVKIPYCSWDCPVKAFLSATTKPFVPCRPAPEARLTKL